MCDQLLKVVTICLKLFLLQVDLKKKVIEYAQLHHTDAFKKLNLLCTLYWFLICSEAFAWVDKALAYIK
ncbi:hypothetical protein KQX54_011966 [Cotesia glomerata]|uniref:Uncharacterized protein n=1 Tax=Cotesia glomerata TaxID=32391 RepID=A0AAV7J0Z9_COTGL|nr:hypothetical protein KQX54_011966 [Cotesia glomerata]